MKPRGTIRERIIRVLLDEPNGALTKYQLAKKAESSYPWAHEFINKLENKKFVRGTTVIDFTGLVNYWLQVKTKPEKKEYLHKDPISIIRKTRLTYALTTYQAESLVQHYLFPSRIDLYIRKEEAERWHQLLTNKGLVGKGNVRLLITDPHVFYGSSKRQNLTVVSIPQLIVDLLEEGGVCAEAAEKLITKVEQHAIQVY